VTWSGARLTIQYEPSRTCKNAGGIHLQDRLAVACMHAGFRLYRINHGSEQGVAVDAGGRYRYMGGHTSLGYGMDWQWNGGGPPVVASASFYDHRLEVWSPPAF
jgi:hypothetical protein